MKPNIDCKDVFGLSTGVESLTREETWLFPNPASTFIQLKLSASEQSEFSLWDTRGHRIMQRDVSETEQLMLPQNLADGIYLARLTSKTGVKTTRMLIQR